MAVEAKHEEIVSRRGKADVTEKVAERIVERPRPDLFARVIGFLVFLLGIAIIVGVLWLAFQMWNDPNLGIAPAAPASSKAGAAATGPTAADIGIGFGRLILRIGLLFLGSISGSLIANKGIKLYFSAYAPHNGQA